jgi:Luciferase-like monooxygenase
MQFGLFGSAAARRGSPEFDSSEGFRDFIDYNVEAEALGFRSTFLVEHHFTGFGQVSATLHLLTWLGARTSRLRLGTAVTVLPWHNPVLLAEQAATLDLLSGGRLDFGIGKGYRYNELAGFCVPMEEAEARFDESIKVILKAWTASEPFSHRGTYWSFENVVVEPPTAQKPHPPIWMGAGGERSIRQVAEKGYNMLLGQYASPQDVGQSIAIFKAAVEASGRRFDPMQVGVSRAFFVAAVVGQKVLLVRVSCVFVHAVRKSIFIAGTRVRWNWNQAQNGRGDQESHCCPPSWRATQSSRLRRRTPPRPDRVASVGLALLLIPEGLGIESTGRGCDAGEDRQSKQR